MRSSTTCLWLHLSVIFVISIALVNGRAGSRKPKNEKIYVKSECFQVRGVPTLRLQCPPTETGQKQLIHVKSAFYGVPAERRPDGENSCVYRKSERHCVQLADNLPENSCNGRNTCVVHVSNPYLMNCRQYAVYMQINHTCLPRSESIDICSSRRTLVAGGTGFIRSPTYPEVGHEPARKLCQCQLRATAADHERPSTPVTVRILDMSLTIPSGEPTADDDDDIDEDGQCHSNYLHVTGLVRRCSGHVTADLPDSTEGDVNSNEALVVEFQSDAGRARLDRGFWIEFSSSDERDLDIECDTLWSEQITDYRTPVDQLTPKPVTSSHRDVIAAPSIRIAAPTTAASARVIEGNSDGRSTMTEEVGGVNNVEVMSVQPRWTPEQTNNKLSTSLHGHVTSSKSDVQQKIADQRRPEADKLSDVESAIPPNDQSAETGRHVESLEHQTNDNQRHRADEASGLPSAALVTGEDGSEIFENLDLSLARESLKSNVDEVQIVTGIVIGILILVSICIIIILVFRRK